MLISFTQTYGNDRKQLLEIYFRDKKLHEIKNLCDLNLYSFHNTSDEIVKYFIDNNPVKNTEILRFNGVSYSECIRNMMRLLEESKCTHFFWSQDDTFSGDNDDINFNELIDYAKTYDNNFMLSFCAGYYMSQRYEKSQLKLLKSLNNFNIFENYTTDYVVVCNMDDSPYLCTMDLVRNIYDDEYFKYHDIWSAEGYLTRKFQINKMPRHMSGRHLFQNYNMIGRNTWSRDIAINELRKKNLI